MIFDTSVWVDFLRGRQTANAELLQHHIYNDEKVFICPIIYQEILQGVKNEHELVGLKELLLALDFLSLDGYFAADGGAAVYRQLRAAGLTIRKPNDCAIAFYAIHFNLKLVHNDSDFDKIAKLTSLETYAT